MRLRGQLSATPVRVRATITAAMSATAPPVGWEAREARCPRCLHWWASHGVPGEDGYACGIATVSTDKREHGIFEVCGCTFAQGNTITPRQVRIWHD